MLTAVVEGMSDQGAVARVLGSAQLTVDRWLLMGGKTKLDDRLPAYLRAARELRDSRWVVFRDADGQCAAQLRARLLGPADGVSPLLLRLAQPETEAWLLGDGAAISTWLGVPEKVVPVNPEGQAHAKQALLNLARRARRRDLRDGLVRDDGHPGPRYVAEVNNFAQTRWNPQAARQNCPSLDRALTALANWKTI